MRVLLVGDLKTSAQLGRSLQSKEWEVQAAQSEASALSMLETVDSPNIALLVVGQKPERTIELLQKIRALQSTRHIYPLCVGKMGDSFLAASFEAGAEGSLRAPFPPELLLARVGGLARLIKMRAADPDASAHFEAVAEADKNAPAGPLDALLSLPPWRDARRDLATAAEQFLGLPASVKEVRGDYVFDHSCGILLSNVESEVKLRIGLGIAGSGASALTVHLFGEDGDDLAGDMMNELGNICMGTMKRTFGDHSVPFTGGLPKAIPGEEVLRPTETYMHQQVFVIQLATAQLVVHTGIRSTANAFVTVRKLTEGMVLAKDLFNARGILLVNGGTRLSSAMVDKLFRMLPPDHEVEVQSVDG